MRQCYKRIKNHAGENTGVGKVKKDDRSHIGMNNIKSRLKEMLNADVIVESVVNKGTTVTIKIPKEDIPE